MAKVNYLESAGGRKKEIVCDPKTSNLVLGVAAPRVSTMVAGSLAGKGVRPFRAVAGAVANLGLATELRLSGS